MRLDLARARRMARVAWRNLNAQRMRSTLSLIGIVFGVTAVVALGAFGEGARRRALAQVSALGIDTIHVRTPTGEQTSSGLRFEDVDILKSVVPSILAVTALREAQLPVEGPRGTVEVGVIGTTVAYAQALRVRVARGRFLASVDEREARRVAVLGAALARDLFPVGDSLGHWLRVGGDWYNVIGILESRSAATGEGVVQARDLNTMLLVPIAALDWDAGQGLHPEGVAELTLRISALNRVVSAGRVIDRVLARSTGGAELEQVIPLEILRQRERTDRLFRVVTAAIAAVTLIVGGIGIMNMMLVSVTERQAEIGIRRAVGATRPEIAALFLFESAVLTSVGSTLGLALGTGAAFAIHWVGGWPIGITLGLPVSAALMALTIGIASGAYPAWRASLLQPMLALRG